jgi:hypothetical protein
MTVTTKKIKGPAAIQHQLVLARAQLKARLSRAASISERKWLADQITVANIAPRELRNKRVLPKVYRKLDELTDRERVMARLAKEIGCGRDVIYHGTRDLPAVMRAGKLISSDFAERAVFFTRSPEVETYFACLGGEKKERRSPGVLVLDRSPDFVRFEEIEPLGHRELPRHEQERVFANEFVSQVQRFIDFLFASDGFQIL